MQSYVLVQGCIRGISFKEDWMSCANTNFIQKKLLEPASYSTDIVSNPEKFQAMKIAIPVKPHNSRNEMSLTASKTGKVKKEPVETEVKEKDY